MSYNRGEIFLVPGVRDATVLIASASFDHDQKNEITLLEKLSTAPGDCPPEITFN